MLFQSAPDSSYILSLPFTFDILTVAENDALHERSYGLMFIMEGIEPVAVRRLSSVGAADVTPKYSMHAQLTKLLCDMEELGIVTHLAGKAST
jgi:hypothetical protein